MKITKTKINKAWTLLFAGVALAALPMFAAAQEESGT